MTKSGRPYLSQAEIAQACSVSQATASLVLRDPSTTRVSSATREKILRYVAQHRVRAVSRKRGRRIALLCGLGRGSLDGGYLERLLTGVQRRAAVYKRSVEIAELEPEGDLSTHELAATCSGIIACRLRITEEQVTRAIGGGVPVVLLECDAGTESCDVVRADNTACVVTALRHLHHHGHRRVAWYGQRPAARAWPHGRTHFERLSAWRTGVAALGLDEDDDLLGVVDQHDAPDATKRLLQRWLALPRPPTAIACYNDIHALTIIRDAISLGCSLPKDLSVIGIDAGAAGALTTPSLTTVDPGFEELGRAAVDQLMLRLEHDEIRPAHIIQCHPRLIERRSVHTITDYSS